MQLSRNLKKRILPAFDKSIISDWNSIYVEKHPLGSRLIIIWDKGNLVYYDSELNKLDPIKYSHVSFPLKYSLINSKLSGSWVFDTIYSSEEICTLVDIDELSAIENNFGILFYDIRRHTMETIFGGIPEKYKNVIKLCDSKLIEDISHLHIPKEIDNSTHLIMKSGGLYSFDTKKISFIIG